MNHHKNKVELNTIMDASRKTANQPTIKSDKILQMLVEEVQRHR